MMKDVGVLKKTNNLTFEYAGKIYGKLVVGFVDSVDGGRILLREMPEDELQEIVALINKNKTAQEDKPTRQRKPKDNQTGQLFTEE